jgi:hypothetical protein
MTAVHGLVSLVFLSMSLGCDPPEQRMWSQQPHRVIASTAQVSSDSSVPVPEPEVTDCETLEHTSRCRLTSVVAQDQPQSGEREVVAMYTTMGEASVIRIERRFKLTYLDRNEGAISDHIRTYPMVDCHWQTVLRGRCVAAPATVDLPPMAPQTTPSM